MTGIAPALRLALAAVLLPIGPASAQEPGPVPGPTMPAGVPSSPQPGALPDAPTPADESGLDLAPRVAPFTGDCTIEGGDGPDRLIGTPGPDVICGFDGDDILEGLEGDDVLDGGSGADIATWESAACCVRADLGAGNASGGLGTDQLVEIESLAGSQGTDLLRGSAVANTISGNGGIDLLFGGDGDDWLVGGDGDDWLAGESGTNILDGGTGANLCADGAGSFCEPLDPADGPDTRGPLDIALIDASPTTDPTSWRVSVRHRVSSSRLWDDGYVVVSFDTQGGDEFETHALIRWDKRRPIGLVIPEGRRAPSGRLEVQGSGRAFTLQVPLARLGLDPSRLYYRWSARTIYTGNGCKPCLDAVPDSRAYPQPLVTA